MPFRDEQLFFFEERYNCPFVQKNAKCRGSKNICKALIQRYKPQREAKLCSHHVLTHFLAFTLPFRGRITTRFYDLLLLRRVVPLDSPGN